MARQLISMSKTYKPVGAVSAQSPSPVTRQYGTGHGAVRTRGAASRSTLPDRPPIPVFYFDEQWQRTANTSMANVEHGPVVTADGEFAFTLSSNDRQLRESMLICVIQFDPEEGTWFATRAQALVETNQWIATFRSMGLPILLDESSIPVSDLVIPLEQVQVYGIPWWRWL